MPNAAVKSKPGWREITLWMVLGLCCVFPWYMRAARMVYRAAAANVDPFTAIMQPAKMFLLATGIWFIAGVFGLIISVARWNKTGWRVRVFTVILVVLPLASVLFAGFGAPSGRKEYMEGLTSWADRNVDVRAIRDWLRARNAVTAPTPVPAGDWPSAVRRIRPDEVDELPSGLALTWGRTAEFSSRRQVFATREGKPAPLGIKWGDHWQDDGPGAWHPGKPGVWVAAQ